MFGGVYQGAGKGLLGVRCWAHAGADVRVDGVGGCAACWEGVGTGRVDGLGWFLWSVTGSMVLLLRVYLLTELRVFGWWHLVSRDWAKSEVG